MTNLKLTLGSAVNMQSTAINPNAAPVATPRQGGFTLRNRINWANVNSSAATTIGTIASHEAAATNYYLMEVPKRTVLRGLAFMRVPGQTAVAHAFDYTSKVSSAHASTAKSAKFEIGVAAYKSASQKASSIKASTTGLHASIAVTKKTGVIASTFGASSASTPYAFAVNHTTSNQREGISFPYGGFVTMAFKTGSSAVTSYDKSSAITGGTFTGQFEVQADCGYIPE